MQAGLIASEDKIQAELAQSALLQAGLSKEKREAILISLELMNTDTKELFSTKSCTKEKLLNKLATKGVTGAKAEEILTTLGLSGANGKAALSFNLLTKSIQKTFAAMLMNPMTWVMIAIAGVATVAYQTSQAIKDVREKAKDLGSSFEETTSDIDNYKARIAELQDTIADHSSSISEVTDARKELMAIQDELIEKYGSEAGAITDITNAINGQSDALDNLGKKEWQETKNEFNDSGFWNNVGNAFGGYGDNIDRMVSEYGDYTASINLTKTGMDASELEELERVLQTVYGAKMINFYDGSRIAEFNGDATEVYNTLLKVQGLSSRFDFSNNLEGQLTNAVNRAKEFSDQYSDMYNQYVLNEKIFPDSNYNDIYKDLTNAHEEYQNASLSGDEKAIQEKGEAYARLLTDSLKNIKEEDVANFFQDMYPDLQQVVAEWTFKLNFEPNTDGLKDDVVKYLDEIDGEADGKTSFSADDISHFNPKTATGLQSDAYDGLQAVAGSYGMEPGQLIRLLQELGLVQSESYQNLVDYFGEENVKKLSPEDLTYAYEIENVGDITFEELEEEIQKAKENANASGPISFSDAFYSDDFAQSRESLLSLAQSGELTPSVLSSTEEYASLLSKTGLSAKDAAEEILNLMDSTDKLAAASSGIQKLQNAYSDFQEHGFVLAETLSGLPDVFRELNGFDSFAKIVGDPANNPEQIQGAFNQIVKEYLSSQNTMSDLSESNMQSYIANLKTMGIANAEEVVNSFLSDNIVENTTGETYNAYLRYLESKDSADLAYFNSLVSKNSSLAQALGSGYQSDYDNWITLLEEKANAYNTFVSSVNLSQIDIGPGSAALSEEGSALAKAKAIVADAKKNGTQSMDYDPFFNPSKPVTKHTKEQVEAAQNYIDSVEKANQAEDLLSLGLSTITPDFGGPLNLSGSRGAGGNFAQQTVETFNFIETAISRAKDRLDQYKTTATETFLALTDRNTAYAQSLTAVADEIYLQNHAKSIYLDKANSVGLEAEWAALVRDGDLNISDITDDGLKEQIKKYKEWYEKALECDKALQQLEKTQKELTQEKIELQVKKYDQQTTKAESEVKRIQNYVDLKEAYGRQATEKHYKGMNKYTKKQIDYTIKQNGQLRELQKTTAKGSEAWNEYQKRIDDNNNSIKQLTKSMAENAVAKFQLTMKIHTLTGILS